MEEKGSSFKDCVYGSKRTLGENCFFYDFLLSLISSTFEAFCTQSYQEGLTVE